MMNADSYNRRVARGGLIVAAHAQLLTEADHTEENTTYHPPLLPSHAVESVIVSLLVWWEKHGRSYEITQEIWKRAQDTAAKVIRARRQFMEEDSDG